MRKNILTLLLLAVAGMAMASGSFLRWPASLNGKATMVVNGSDTIYLFDGNPELVTADGSLVDWYLTTDTLNPVNTNASEYLSINSGDGVAVRHDGQWVVRYVFNYHELEPDIAISSVTPRCQSTLLGLSGTIPTILYTSLHGQTRELKHVYDVSLTTLGWNGETWSDSLAVMSKLPLTIKEDNELPERILRMTPVTVYYDSLWRSEMGLTVSPVTSADIEPIAVDGKITTLTTTRGDKVDPMKNEAERPVESSVLSGSAPIEILFRSNPTPAVEFYQWKLYKGSSLLLTRQDEETRYTFMEPGVYKMVCYVSNPQCPCSDPNDPDCKSDSIGSVEVRISESYLHVPQAFTPNGDGINDEFKVDYQSLREFNCKIYNRWGKLVYEWSDPAKGWDGTINGLPAQVGAYYYVIRAMGTDAGIDAEYMSKISYDKKLKKGAAGEDLPIGIYQMAGDINLLR